MSPREIKFRIFLGPLPMTFPKLFLGLIDFLALFYLIMMLWIPFYWFLFHPAIQFWRRIGNKSFWLALPVWLGFGITIVATRHQILAHRIERNALTWIIGGILFAIATWLDSQTRHTFGWKRLVGLAELHPEHRLSGVVREGVYGRVRHPRYLLYMLMIASMAFLTGARPMFLLALVNILMYQILAPLEERKLLDQYGPEYAAYQRSVPRFLPNFK
jgi:protein-S-isoprenylcysteine O-methyltransferase Ste14